MRRNPSILRFRKSTSLPLIKLYNPIRALPLPFLLPFLALTVFSINYDLFAAPYPSLTLSAESDPGTVELARIAVRDQLVDGSTRLPPHLFPDDAENEAILIQKVKIPPVFATRLGSNGRRHLLRKLTVDSNGIPMFDSMPKVVIIDLQNGLGNRLRALGSAMEFAFSTRRVLIILWAADAHINATMSDLFHPDLLSSLLIIEQPVQWPINPSDIHLALKAPGPTKVGDNSYMKTFSYMAKDRHMLDGTLPIKNFAGKHVYVKTAYILRSYYTKHNLVNAFVQALTPAPAVTSLVQGVEKSSGGPHAINAMVGVHIRSRTILHDNDAVDHECEYTIEGAATTDKWRGMSTPKQFIPEMYRIRAQWPAIVKRSYTLAPDGKWSPRINLARAIADGDDSDVISVDTSVPPRFYVSADSVETLESLYRVFSKDDIVSLPRNCDDRGATCILYAFADLILLSRTGALLASGWSSFSEAAMRLRVRPFGMVPSGKDGYVIRTSGVDFGGPSSLDRLRNMIQSWLEKVGVFGQERMAKHVLQEERRKLCEKRRRNANLESNVT